MGLFDKDLVEKEIYISYAEGSHTYAKGNIAYAEGSHTYAKGNIAYVEDFYKIKNTETNNVWRSHMSRGVDSVVTHIKLIINRLRLSKKYEYL